MSSIVLDEFQLPFVEDTRRALRLLAPAGSGKTNSLLWRCLHQWQIAAKSKPRFLVFTFTRTARDELRDRLRSSLEFAPIAGAVEISTLNSWGFRRLKSRTHSLRLLVSNSDLFFAVHNNLQPVWSKYPKINDLLVQMSSRTRTAKAIMKIIDGLKSLGFRHDRHHTFAEFAGHFEWLNQAGLSTYLNGLLQMLIELQILDFGQGVDKAFEQGFLTFWREATVSLRSMAMITLEDQKYWAWLDLEESLAEKKFTTGVHRCEHILVDEFQDINCLDLRLLQSIAAINKAELTLIGDDDQAIYEWRGASPQFIVEPDKHVGAGYVTHILSRNYRSPRNIVDLSQKLIQNNTRRVAKDVRAVSSVDARVNVFKMPSILASIEFVVGEVQRLLADDGIRNVVLIGRKRSQIIPYQIVFASHNIPFYAAEDLQVFLSDAFGDLKEILGIKARAGVGPIPGFDPINDLIVLLDKVKRFQLKKSDRTAVLQYLQKDRPRTLSACVTSLRNYRGPLKGTNSDGSMSRSFADAVDALLKSATVAGTIHAISENFDGLQKDYGKSIEDVFYTDPPFLHLAEFAERYGNDYMQFDDDVGKAIATLARVPDDEAEETPNREPEWKLPLHLMTAMRAKGKEFDAVIILDVNQGIWPSKLSTTEEQLEQERRVFYVAFTRVRKQLTILVADSIAGQSALPSPYLQEMGLQPVAWSKGK